MNGIKDFTICFKKHRRELSEFYDGIMLFILAIPYVIIYTVTNYFTRLWAFRWRESNDFFSYMPYWRAVDAKVEGASQTYSRRRNEFCKNS